MSPRRNMMFFAGYIYLGYDPETREHRLFNRRTGTVEIWETRKYKDDETGIIYKNTFLIFKRMEDEL